MRPKKTAFDGADRHTDRHIDGLNPPSGADSVKIIYFPLVAH